MYMPGAWKNPFPGHWKQHWPESLIFRRMEGQELKDLPNLLLSGQEIPGTNIVPPKLMADTLINHRTLSIEPLDQASVFQDDIPGT